ncbi:STAS domain-containing protein [Planosporangium thailandense]|uniref:STAS domain-containing protein n=1 Tax=Planosporangium thailandense TaxID=765197 RepID=A0ABX0XT07_9ACTN|nr:STAS domain-containing protein [Planosporangium thailandense]NJC69136.1 STAS domain-containing protein [Planosporangium thailandense]
MTGAMIYTRRAPDGSVLVEVRGEVDIQSSNRLRDILIDTVTHQMPTKIMVDLLHVTFIDSTGIGALAAGRNAATQRHLGFAVRNANGFVAAQLRQTGLYDELVVPERSTGPSGPIAPTT